MTYPDSLFIAMISWVTARGSAFGSAACATDHRLSPGPTVTRASGSAAWLVASATPAPSQADVTETSSADAAAATIRPRIVNRRPGFCITVAVWDTVCRDPVAVCMMTLQIKLSFGVSQFDRTPVRSYASSTEPLHIAVVHRGSDIFGTRRTDVWSIRKKALESYSAGKQPRTKGHQMEETGMNATPVGSGADLTADAPR